MGVTSSCNGVMNTVRRRFQFRCMRGSRGVPCKRSCVRAGLRDLSSRSIPDSWWVARVCIARVGLTYGLGLSHGISPLAVILRLGWGAQ